MRRPLSPPRKRHWAADVACPLPDSDALNDPVTVAAWDQWDLPIEGEE